MAPRTADGELTSKQKQIVTYVNSDKPVAEIAKKLGMKPGAVYQQISRLRRHGHLPPKPGTTATKAAKPKAKANVKASGYSSTAREQADAEFERTIPPSSNGSRTLDQHLADELAAAVSRIEEIRSQRAALEDEEGELDTRRAKLDAASKALSA